MNDRHETESPDRNDDLARLLRHGDPADDGRAPDPVELAEMRQSIVAAADESAPSPGFLTPTGGWRIPVPLMAATGLAVVALGVWLVWSPGTPESSGTAASPPAEPKETIAAPIPELPETAPAGEEAPPLVADGPPAPAAEAAGPPAESVAAGDEREARVVHFTAPRGTRIIWTLDPNFESPVAEPKARQEQSP